MRRRRIEAIEGVNERYRFTAARGGSKRGPCHARAPGRSGSHHFRDLASRQATGKPAIQGIGIEGGNGVFAQTVGQCRGEGAVEFSVSEEGFDDGFDGHIHLNFAKLSLL